MLIEIVSHYFRRCRNAMYLLQRLTSFYFTMAQITHGSYFNIAPMDIVGRLFDFWMLITSLLFQSIVISRSEHGIRGRNAACRIKCIPCILMPGMRIFAQYGHSWPICGSPH